MSKATTDNSVQAYPRNDRLKELFEEWRRMPHHGISDSDMYVQIEREEVLERQIAAEPAASPAEIRHKLEIIKDYVDIGPPTDGRAFLMIASIDADLANLKGGVS